MTLIIILKIISQSSNWLFMELIKFEYVLGCLW